MENKDPSPQRPERCARSEISNSLPGHDRRCPAMGCEIISAMPSGPHGAQARIEQKRDDIRQRIDADADTGHQQRYALHQGQSWLETASTTRRPRPG